MSDGILFSLSIAVYFGRNSVVVFSSWLINFLSDVVYHFFLVTL